MMRRIIVGFVISLVVISIGFKTAYAAEKVCDTSGVSHRSISTKANTTEGMVYMYLFTKPDGTKVEKTGYFYRQTILSSGKLAFCLDMGNRHGSVYTVSPEEYIKVRNAITGVCDSSDSTESCNKKKDYIAIKILTIQAAVEEEWEKFVVRDAAKASSLDYSLVKDIAYIVAQVSAWAFSEGVPNAVMNRNPGSSEFEKQDPMRIILAQALCAIQGHPGELSRGVKNFCTYEKGVNYDNQADEFKKWYEKIGGYDENWTQKNTEYNFVMRVWNTFGNNNHGGIGGLYEYDANDTYSNAVFGYSNGSEGFQPTIFKPASSNEQRLLSFYKCVDKTVENPGGCWKLYTDIPNACAASDNSGFVSDTEDWSCIFKASTSTNNVIQEHYDMDKGNKYCHVFCREEINFEFPDSGTRTVQGSYLVVNGSNASALNNIFPLEFTGTKTCRPTSSGRTGYINYPQFEEDYIVADRTVRSKWAAYQQTIADHEACLAQPYNTGSSMTADGWWRTSQCKAGPLVKNPDRVQDCVDSYEARLEAYYESEADVSGWPAEAISAYYLGRANQLTAIVRSYNSCYNSIPKNYCMPDDDRDISDGATDFYHARTWKSFSKAYGEYTGNVSQFTEYEPGHDSYNGSHDSYCNTYEAKIAKAKSDYEQAVTDRNNLLNMIESCIDEKRRINYDSFLPKLKISYEEPVYGKDSGWELKSSLTKSESSSELYINSSSTSSSTDATEGSFIRNIVPAVCVEKKRCVDGSDTYETADWWETIETRIRKYKLPDNLYKYVEKGSGQSIHKENAKTGVEYLDMGFGNLPIHYSTSPNLNGSSVNFTSSGIPIYDDSYEFKIYTITFGNQSNRVNKFNNYIFGNQKFNGLTYYNDYKDYICQYIVDCNKMISDNPACPDTPSTGDGLNLVYRTISMYNKTAAFPGQTGNGRTPGNNWTNSEISSKIVNNRGVKNYEIYTKLDPLYEIELTPGLMQKIRKYNKKQNTKTTTIYNNTTIMQSGLVGYSNYDDFDCDSSGVNCKSKFLRGQIQDFTEVKVTGCAISSGKNGYNCSGSDVAW